VTKGELLLHWLTHVREGSWSTFRRALSAVEAAGDDPGPTAVRMSARLSERAHVEFFVDGGNRWRTFAPLLGGLCEPSTAVLTGGRTPRLVDALARSCEQEGGRIEVREMPEGPDMIRVAGPQETIRRVATGAGLHNVPALASALCAALEPITAALGSAIPGAPPINWSVRSFDLEALRWVDELLPHTAYEYRSRHGGLRHYVRGAKHMLLELDRRNAVYAAAYLNRVGLISYEEEERRLIVPRGAPLPEATARAVAACSGDPAAEEYGRIIYGSVPPAIAGVVLTTAGQRPPEPHWMSEQRSAR
jgi:hypothetical protein